MPRYSERDRAEAIATLREHIRPGQTVHLVLRHRSRSGMSRAISPVILRDGTTRDFGPLAARAIGLRYSERHDGVRLDGCGMDMGFQLVYLLGCALYAEGFTCTGDRCPSNDHSNGDRDHSPHHHNAGGYALRHHWL